MVFKKIFAVEENKDLLIALINSIVSKEDRIANITLLNPYFSKNFQEDRLSFLNIKAERVDGKKFDIEIKKTYDAEYDEKALSHWAKRYTEQLKNNEDAPPSKAFGIHILDFSTISGNDYHSVFHIPESEPGYRELELHTVELDKFSRSSKTTLSDILSAIHTPLDMWVAFFNYFDLMNQKDNPLLDNPYLKKALNVLEVMHLNDEEKEVYENNLKWFRDVSSALKHARADKELMDRMQSQGLPYK